jgi:hypothetical protein
MVEEYSLTTVNNFNRTKSVEGPYSIDWARVEENISLPYLRVIPPEEVKDYPGILFGLVDKVLGADTKKTRQKPKYENTREEVDGNGDQSHW